MPVMELRAKCLTKATARISAIVGFNAGLPACTTRLEFDAHCCTGVPNNGNSAAAPVAKFYRSVQG